MTLRQLTRDQLAQVSVNSIDEATCDTARTILDEVRTGGEAAVRGIGERLGDLSHEQPLILARDDLQRAWERLTTETATLLERTAARIRRFAEAQRAALRDCELQIEGGHVAHRWLPLEFAGCYAPGGRYPLPSSVLMTALTARVAGVREVWVASPRPTDATLAAAALAEANGVLAVGGAQAIGALAYGLDGVLPPCDVVVGPGNRFVTAAKSIIARDTRIDMLAGPSELVVAASGDADPTQVAADLIAQAEHDVDARAILVTDDEELATRVNAQIEVQLADLPTSATAAAALAQSGYVLVSGADEAIACCRLIAPEHLSLQGATYEAEASRFTAGASLFIGSASPQVLGDYGVGPNHALPTGRSARAQSGLSVPTFLRLQTQVQIDDFSAAQAVIGDAAALGRLEGLEGHARSAQQRLHPAGSELP